MDDFAYENSFFFIQILRDNAKCNVFYARSISFFFVTLILSTLEISFLRNVFGFYEEDIY